MRIIILIILCVSLIACNNISVSENKPMGNKFVDSAKIYDNWKTAKGESIEFKYPSDWRIKTKAVQGTTQFGLTFDPDTSDIFYPVEIWEFNASGGTFDDFSSAPHEYFKRMTGDKKASLMNQSKIQFKKFDAKKFEFNSENYPVEITTINGVKNYYMLVLYKEDKVDSIANTIFNSIDINSN